MLWLFDKNEPTGSCGCLPLCCRYYYVVHFIPHFIPANSMRVQQSISFLWFDPPVGSCPVGWKELLTGSDQPDLLYLDPRFAILKGNRQKSPKWHLRALGKSYRKPPEAPTPYFLSIAPSGCLQGRRHARGVTDSYSMSMVRFPFLYLQKLF